MSATVAPEHASLEPIMNEWFRAYLIGRLLRWRFSPEEAEEVVHDTYLWLLKNANKYDPSRSKPTTYAFLVMQRIIHVRRSSRMAAKRAASRTCELEPIHTFIADAKQENPCEQAARMEMSENVRRIVDQCVPIQKDSDALWRHYRDGLNMREIGDEWGVSFQRIHQRIKKSLGRIAEVVPEEWAEDV